MSGSSESGGVATRAAFDFVRYASVWEDADVLCEALAPVATGRRLLSIASAGDNALAMLTLDPSEVVAVDLSAAQLACVELRRAAFLQLSHPALLAFLGVTPSAERLNTYAGLRGELPESAKTFWDAHPDGITNGIIHHGKFERYFSTFRRQLLPLVHSARTVHMLREANTLEEQEAFYTSHWNTWRWRTLFALFFSRFAMGRLGRDPAFFEHVEGSVADRILARTRYALTRIPVATNPYLAYILTGNFTATALPRYLRPEFHTMIRDRLGRLRLSEGPADTVDGPFHGFNLSDIFEYMSDTEHARVYRALVDRAAPGARLVYWNMLVPRARPDADERTIALTSLAETLHAKDNAWFYQRLHVDERVGSGEQ